MRYTTGIIGGLVALIVFAAVSSSAAGEIETGILQYHVDRLYFPHGNESRVYEHAGFYVYKWDSVIFKGTIDHAWTGISISEPTNGFFDTIEVAALRVGIIAADVDTLAQLNIGTDMAPSTFLADTAADSRVNIQTYTDRSLMFDDYRGGLLDAVVTFASTDAEPGQSSVQSVVYPYVATLIPNVGKACNFQGQLTTSLYYRFDPDRLDLLAEGTVRPLFRFHEHPLCGDLPFSEQSTGRLFPYNPESGRSLFSNLTNRPSKVRLYVSDPSLQRVGLYCADLLARDRCKVELTDRRDQADLYVEYVPVSATLPSLTVFSLRQLLSRDLVPETAATETVGQISHSLDYLSSAITEDEYYRTIETIERKMIEDLGVFPLFYPVYHVQAHRCLQGVNANSLGRLDFSHAFKVLLPSASEGASAL